MKIYPVLIVFTLILAIRVIAFLLENKSLFRMIGKIFVEQNTIQLLILIALSVCWWEGFAGWVQILVFWYVMVNMGWLFYEAKSRFRYRVILSVADIGVFLAVVVVWGCSYGLVHR